MMLIYKNNMTMSRFVSIVVLLLCSAQTTAMTSDGAEVNRNLFYGNVDVSALLSGDELDQGDLLNNRHILDVYLNGKLNNRDTEVRFVKNNNTDKAEPCLSQEQFQQLNLVDVPLAKTEQNCYLLSDISEYSRWHYNKSELQLDITMPQIMLKKSAGDGVAKELWDEGITAAYVKHRTSYSYQAYKDQDDYNQLSGSIYAGVNIGLVQFRHNGYFRHDFDSGNGSEYQSYRSYFQVPVARYESLFTAGENFTAGGLFGSLSYTGLNWATDTRMWSSSRKGYAPRVTGVALSNARVEIKQGDNTIYEVSVPPGPFLIDDLLSIPQQGDLTVNVYEADGSIKTSTVPYSVLPDSLRFGNTEYNFVIGEARDFGDVNALFLEGTFKQGYSNVITTNYGFRFADRYQAYLLGGVFSSSYGAFGFNTTYSHTRIDANQAGYQGWQTELNYGRSFDSGFNITMVAMRNSTKGYRTLENVFGLRQVSDGSYDSSTLNQRNHFNILLNQSLGDYGQIGLSAQMSDYYQNRPTSYNYSARYSHTLWGVSYNVNVDRQKISRYSGESNVSSGNRYQTVVSLGLSVPLGGGLFNLGHTVTNNVGDNGSSTASYSNSIGDDFSYSLMGSHNDSGSFYSVSATQQTPIGGVSASYSNGGLNASGNFSTVLDGTVLLHSGGVTVGPYVGDSFALVEASGAEGAAISGWSDSKVDSFGYAIHPSLSPYRFNDIDLDTTELEEDVELTRTHKKVVPYSGAIVKVKFNTRKGRAYLIDTKLSEGGVPPLGSDVITVDNRRIGIVGQAGVIYARLEPQDTQLKLRWGKAQSEQCSITVEQVAEDSSPISKMEAICS